MDQQRDLHRGGVELGFAALARGMEGSVLVGGGPPAGEVWPAGIEGRLGDLRCPVISVAAQIEIKLMMAEWVPGLRRRQKDLDDIDRLEELLRGGS